MRITIRVIIAVVLLTAGGTGWLLCCDGAAPGPQSRAIAVGDRLNDVQARLRAATIDFTHRGFAFVYVEDQDNLRCPLDENHACAAIFYSKSRRVVTGIKVFFYQSRQAGKADQTCLAARSIEFERDGSYRIHFAPPVNEPPAVQRSPGEIPPGGRIPPPEAVSDPEGDWQPSTPPTSPAPSLPPLGDP